MNVSFLISGEREELGCFFFDLGLGHISVAVVCPANHGLVILSERLNFQSLKCIVMRIAIRPFGCDLRLNFLHYSRFDLFCMVSLRELGLVFWNNSLDQVVVSVFWVSNVII